ncbi:hypothetical protein Tco_0669891, partial [Tanacetum coccineum]
VQMDNHNITMDEYIRLEEEKSHRRGKVYNWETATYGKIWDNKDVHDLGCVETEFSAIVFNDTLTSEADDMLIIRTNMDVINQTKKMLHSSFDMKDMGEADYISWIRIPN